ncbi:MAG: pilus assembly protein [Rhodobacteraceae bacterium]|nr:pilus assembly protein [Paracoccaceae bacterium]
MRPTITDIKSNFQMKRDLWNRRRKMSSDERGSVTIEFVLWVPVFVFILALTIDSSMIFVTQSNMWSVTRDTTRHMSTGLYTDGEAEVYASRLVEKWGQTPSISTTSDSQFVSVSMSIPISEVVPFNVIGAFTNGSIVTQLTQRVEPR